MPLGGPFLLANPAPCAELKFNATQTAKVNSVLRDAEKIYRNDQAELSKLPSAEQARPRRALLAKLIREIKKNLEFTCDQSRRFDQIMLQRQRILAFADPEVVAKLKLNRAQRERIADLQRKADTEVRLLRPKPGEDRASLLKQAAKITRGMTEDAVDALSPEQRAIWRELIGTPFELPGEPEGARLD